MIAVHHDRAASTVPFERFLEEFAPTLRAFVRVAAVEDELSDRNNADLGFIPLFPSRARRNVVTFVVTVRADGYTRAHPDTFFYKDEVLSFLSSD